MKKTYTVLALSFLALLTFVFPSKAHSAAYSVYSPSSPANITCDISDKACEYNENIVFVNASNQMLFETTFWTGGSLIKYHNSSGGYISGTSKLEWPSVIEPNHLVAKFVKVSNPQVVGEYVNNLYIDGKVCNRDVTPWDCYFYGGNSFEVKMTVVDNSVSEPIPSPTVTLTPSPTPTTIPTTTPSPTPTPPLTPSPTPTKTPSSDKNAVGGLINNDDNSSNNSANDSSEDSSQNETTNTTDEKNEVQNKNVKNDSKMSLFEASSESEIASESSDKSETPDSQQEILKDETDQQSKNINFFKMFLVLVFCVLAVAGSYYYYLVNPEIFKNTYKKLLKFLALK